MYLVVFQSTHNKICQGNVQHAQPKRRENGGTEYLRDDTGGLFRGFDEAGTLSVYEGDPQYSNRPFDEDRSGFVFGEGGSGILVLEDYDKAIARDAKIYAEIKGYESFYDPYNIMVMEPEGKRITAMLEQLMHNGGIAPSNVEYVNAHGTGTGTNDKIEAEVIERLLGKTPLVNSSKSLLGHTLGACGALEAIITALSIETQMVHPSLNIDNPVVDISYAHSTQQHRISHAITQSFAFGGHNAALLMAKV
jgi:3-oxoacyl-[acyl-carrier-protein] synthase II